MSEPVSTTIGDRAVRRIGFGALRLLGPEAFGPSQHPEQAAAVLQAAAAGADLIDTADCYGPGLSEDMIADVLFPYRPGLVIATKGGQECPAAGEWVPCGSSDHLRRACEQSLRRLRLDTIELYQLHAVDPAIGLEPSVETLASLRQEGLIRLVGLCNVTEDELRRAQAIVPIASVQNRYSVAERDDDALVDMCARERIAFLPWFPLDRGSLGSTKSRPLGRVARRIGATPAQVALAWLLHRSPTLLPIPGTRSLSHLRENLAATRLVLDVIDLRELEAASGTAAMA